MSTVTQPAVEIRLDVSADQWREYIEAKAKASALKRDVELMEERMAIPDAKGILTLAGYRKTIVRGSEVLPEKVEAIIVNGNNQTLGKLTVYWFNGAEMPAGYRRRIS